MGMALNTETRQQILRRLAALPPIVFLTMETRPDTAVISTDNRSGAVLATHMSRQEDGLIVVTLPIFAGILTALSVVAAWRAR